MRLSINLQLKPALLSQRVILVLDFALVMESNTEVDLGEFKLLQVGHSDIGNLIALDAEFFEIWKEIGVSDECPPTGIVNLAVIQD